MGGRIGKSGALGKLVPAVVGISLVCAVGCGRKSDPPPDRIETRVGAEHASNGVPFGQSRVTVTFHQYWFDEGIQGDGDDRDMWAEVEFAGSDFYDDLEPGCCSGVLSPGAFPRPSSYSVSRLVNNETNNPLGMGIAMYENDGGQLNNRSPDDDLQNIQPGESNNVTNIDVNLRTGTFSGEQSPDRCDEDGCFACTRSTVSPNDDGLCFTVKVENNCTGHTEPCDIVCVPISTTDMTCDGRDDDCNGQIDDGYAPRAIVCGAGLCQGGGLTACLPGNSPDNHEETPPCPTRPAVCATSDFTCDSCDDNCNGAADEGFPTQTAACGPPGACAGTVTTSCTGGQIVQSGCVGISAPIPERPDGVDNDCDGQTDECTAADWWCACTPGVDLTFHVDLADDGVDPDTEAELCLPGALATGSCRLRGVFRRAEQLQFRGCRVIAQLDARPYHVDDELRLGRGNLLLQGTQRELSVITTTSACADAACNALNCPDRGCGPTCSHGVLHRLINAIADPGAAPGLELRSLTLRGGRIEETANFGPTTASGGSC